MSDLQRFVQTPLFPIYSEARALLSVCRNAVTKPELLGLIRAIEEQTGTPQNPVDWSNPDDWINARLSGRNQDLARQIWTQSGGALNPRHMYGIYLFINTFKLMEDGSETSGRLTVKGEDFLAENAETVRTIDWAEGLPQLLAILAKHSPAKRGDLMKDWTEFLLAHSKYRTSASIKSTLSHRILNLVERGYIHREGNTYTISDKGIAYALDANPPSAQEPHRKALEAVKQHNDAQIAALREQMAQMDPYRFETLVKDLLEAMDYEDVVVTKQSGDRGVDVVANFEFGITRVREVVQVKRVAGTITRPILDQLRGALPYHQAIRGTIITLGKFAQGCKDAAFFPGAAPITLIDGDKLIELMLKHEVGIKKSSLTIHEVDDSYFSGSASEDLPAATRDAPQLPEDE